MAKTTAVCVPDTMEGALCPHCGGRLRTVEYYTAKPVRQQTLQRDFNTQTVVTTYTNVQRRIGGICFTCADKRQRMNRIAGLVVLIAGGLGGIAAMVTGLIRSNIAAAQGGNIGAAMNGPMALMILCLLLAVVGLSVFVGSRAFHPGRALSSGALFLLFLKRMLKEGHHPGLVCLMPEQAAKLEKV